MTPATHRLWAGTLLIIAATTLQALTNGSWAIAMVAGVGVLLILTSFDTTTRRDR